MEATKEYFSLPIHSICRVYNCCDIEKFENKECGHWECIETDGISRCSPMCDSYKVSKDNDKKREMEENIDLNNIIDDEHPHWNNSPLAILREAKGDGLEEPEDEESEDTDGEDVVYTYEWSNEEGVQQTTLDSAVPEYRQTSYEKKLSQSKLNS